MPKARLRGWAFTMHPIKQQAFMQKSHKSSIMPKARPVNGAFTVCPVGVCAEGRSEAGWEREGKTMTLVLRAHKSSGKVT